MLKTYFKGSEEKYDIASKEVDTIYNKINHLNSIDVVPVDMHTILNKYNPQMVSSDSEETTDNDENNDSYENN